MFTQRSECSKCGHYTVCGYKGRYRDFSNDIQKAAERGGLVEDKDAFFVLTECRQWIPIRQNVRAHYGDQEGPEFKEVSQFDESRH